MIVVAMMSACVFAQPAPKPVPQADERVGEFVARWDSWVETIPEDQKAWGLMLGVDEVVDGVQGDGRWFVSGPPSEANEYDYKEDMKDWNWTVEFIGKNSELLEKIREYAGREYAGVPLNDSSYLYHEQLVQVAMPSTFDDLVPRHMRMMRSHLELLLADMYLANQADESGRVIQDMEAVVGMARLSIVTGSMLDQLVVEVFGSTITRRLQEQVIDLDQFSDAHLVQVQEIVNEIQELGNFKSAIQDEAMMSACVFAQPVPELGETVEVFVGRYSQWVDGVPENERAWGEMLAVDQFLDEEFAGQRLTADPQDEDWDTSAGFVRNHREIVNRVREYSSRAYLGMPTSVFFYDGFGDEFPQARSILLPQLGMVYEQSRLLMVDAILAGQIGDHERVLADIQAVRSLQRLIPFTHSMMELLVEIAISSIPADAILAGQIDLIDWTQEDLDHLTSLFLPGEIKSKMNDVVGFERWAIHDMLDWMYEDSKGGELTLHGAKRLMDIASMLGSFDGDEVNLGTEYVGVSAIWQALKLRSQVSQKEFQRIVANQFFDRVLDDFNTTPSLIRSYQSSQFIDTQFDEGHSIDLAPVLVVVIDFTRLYRRSVSASAVDSAVRLLIDIHWEHRVNGVFSEWPTTQTEIADPYLDGGRLKYILVDGDPVIYSVGPDRDDDHGKSILDEDGNPDPWPDFLTLDELEAIQKTNPASIDGDWVLYPAIP